MADETNHALCNAHLLRNLEEIVELEKGWSARMQWLLLAARDVAAHGYETTGGPVPESVRQETAAAWDLSSSQCSITMRACPAGPRPPSRP